MEEVKTEKAQEEREAETPSQKNKTQAKETRLYLVSEISEQRVSNAWLKSSNNWLDESIERPLRKLKKKNKKHR